MNEDIEYIEEKESITIAFNNAKQKMSISNFKFFKFNDLRGR